jgi:hypothetical protein
MILRLCQRGRAHALTQLLALHKARQVRAVCGHLRLFCQALYIKQEACFLMLNKVADTLREQACHR